MYERSQFAVCISLGKTPDGRLLLVLDDVERQRMKPVRSSVRDHDERHDSGCDLRGAWRLCGGEAKARGVSSVHDRRMSLTLR